MDVHLGVHSLTFYRYIIDVILDGDGSRALICLLFRSNRVNYELLIKIPMKQQIIIRIPAIG
jgi:hypothetical protein